jgi:hypothetical protein
MPACAGMTGLLGNQPIILAAAPLQTLL